MQQISYSHFAELDIRIGTIQSAERVPETDKLVKLSVDIGEETPRQVIAGIAEYIEDPSALAGKQIPILANLEPRRLKGLESQGMILASSDAAGNFALLHPSEPMEEGSIVK